MPELEDDLDVRLRWPDADAAPPTRRPADAQRAGSTGATTDRREPLTRGSDEPAEAEQVGVEPARAPRLRVRLRPAVSTPDSRLSPDEELVVLRHEVASLREQLRTLEENNR